MSHDIYQERVKAFDGLPMWHNLGDVELREDMSAVEAIGLVAGDLDYSTEQAFIELPGRVNMHGDPVYVPLDGKRIVVMHNRSDDTREAYGLVSDKFQTICPREFAEMIDGITKTFPVNTVGVLRNGSTIFLALRGYRFSVNGEDYTGYLSFDISNEPGQVARAKVTLVREVCANTNAVAIAQAFHKVEISHVGNVAGKLALAGQLLAFFDESVDAQKQLLESFGRYNVSADELSAVVDAAFPMPTRPKTLQLADSLTKEIIAQVRGGAVDDLLASFTDKEKAFLNACARVENARGIFAHNYGRFNAEYPKFAETAYAVYNGVTETADYGIFGKNKKTGNVGESVLVGTRMRMKLRASEALQDLVSASAN